MRSGYRLLVLSSLGLSSFVIAACSGGGSGTPSGGADATVDAPPGPGTDGGAGGDATAAADATAPGDGGTPGVDASSSHPDASPGQKDAGPTLGDAASTSDGSFAVAPHPPYPTIDYGGEPLIVAPKVVSVIFKTDPFEAQLAPFGAGMTQTPWWTEVTQEYCQPDGGCIGQGPQGVTVVLDAGPAKQYDDGTDAGGTNFQTWLAGLITKGTLPASDANTIYVVYMPSSVTVNGGTGSKSCTDFAGYHDITSKNVVYSIIMECPADDAGAVAYTLADVTVTSAHEVVEAATDGIFNQAGTSWGWAVDGRDPNTWGWMDQGDTELADLCDDFVLSDYWDGGTYAYERIWSMKQAAANKPPCLPLPPGGDVYFNAAPDKAFLELNVGESITIPVSAFSTEARGNWTLLAYDGTSSTKTNAYVTVSFPDGGTDPKYGGSTTSVNNGSVAELTITLTADPSSVQNGMTNSGEADLMLASYDGADYYHATSYHVWPMAVMTRGAAMDGGVRLPDGAVPALSPAQQVDSSDGRRGPRHITRPRHQRHAFRK